MSVAGAWGALILPSWVPSSSRCERKKEQSEFFVSWNYSLLLLNYFGLWSPVLNPSQGVYITAWALILQKGASRETYTTAQKFWITWKCLCFPKKNTFRCVSQTILAISQTIKINQRIFKERSVLFAQWPFISNCQSSPGKKKKKKEWEARSATVQEEKYMTMCNLRQRCITGPQLAAALKSNRHTPVSASTVKRLDFMAELPRKEKTGRKRAKENRHWTLGDWKKVFWTG